MENKKPISYAAWAETQTKDSEPTYRKYLIKEGFNPDEWEHGNQ